MKLLPSSLVALVSLAACAASPAPHAPAAPPPTRTGALVGDVEPELSDDQRRGCVGHPIELDDFDAQVRAAIASGASRFGACDLVLPPGADPQGPDREIQIAGRRVATITGCGVVAMMPGITIDRVDGSVLEVGRTIDPVVAAIAPGEELVCEPGDAPRETHCRIVEEDNEPLWGFTLKLALTAPMQGAAAQRFIAGAKVAAFFSSTQCD